MNSFKELYPAYRNKTVKFEIFPAWEDYTYTLLSALGS
jgi:hypothetical protein